MKPKTMKLDFFLLNLWNLSQLPQVSCCSGLSHSLSRMGLSPIPHLLWDKHRVNSPPRSCADVIPSVSDEGLVKILCNNAQGFQNALQNQRCQLSSRTGKAFHWSSGWAQLDSSLQRFQREGKKEGESEKRERERERCQNVLAKTALATPTREPFWFSSYTVFFLQL